MSNSAPEISPCEMSETDLDFEVHPVPFGSIPVSAFADDAVRSVVTAWWSPQARSDEKLTHLWELLSDIPTLGERKDWKPSPARVRFLLTYPLEKPFRSEHQIDLRAFGSVFGIAYDMYREIYRMDDEDWAAKGHAAPPRHPTCKGNRAKGRYVWGHDMTDLFFEELLFAPSTSEDHFNREPSDSIPFVGTVSFGIGS